MWAADEASAYHPSDKNPSAAGWGPRFCGGRLFAFIRLNCLSNGQNLYTTPTVARESKDLCGEYPRLDEFPLTENDAPM